MDATVTLSRKERRKAQAAAQGFSDAVSEPTENDEAMDAVEPTEALKTAPTASLPLAPITGSLPVALPVTLPSTLTPVPADTADAPKGFIPGEGVNLFGDDEPTTTITPYRSAYEIEQQEGVDAVRAEEMSREEELAWMAKFEARDREATLIREAREAEQAEAERKQSEAHVRYKRSTFWMFVSLIVGSAFIAGFFLMGGF